MLGKDDVKITTLRITTSSLSLIMSHAPPNPIYLHNMLTIKHVEQSRVKL